MCAAPALRLFAAATIRYTSLSVLRCRAARDGVVALFRHEQTENFEPYFDGRKKLMPKPTDLSYYNWETQTSTSNSTPNFQVGPRRGGGGVAGGRVAAPGATRGG